MISKNDKNIAKRNRDPVKIASVSILGFLIGVVLLFYESIYGQPSFGGEDFNGHPIDFFYENPDFLSWVFFIILQTTVFTSLVYPLLSEIKWMKEDFGLETKYIIRSAVVVFFLIAIIYFVIYGIFGSTRVMPALETVLHHTQFKISFMVVFGFFAAGVCMVGILCTYNASCCFDENDRDAVKKYLKIRRYLSTFLLFVGVIISLSTIATAILQQGLSKICPNNCFPLDFAISYGLFNSLYIALIYAPVHFTVYKKGRKILEILVADVDKQNLSWKAKQEEYSAIEDMLQLKADFSTVAKKAIPILAPLIGSIIPGWINIS